MLPFHPLQKRADDVRTVAAAAAAAAKEEAATKDGSAAAGMGDEAGPKKKRAPQFDATVINRRADDRMAGLWRQTPKGGKKETEAGGLLLRGVDEKAHNFAALRAAMAAARTGLQPVEELGAQPFLEPLPKAVLTTVSLTLVCKTVPETVPGNRFWKPFAQARLRCTGPSSSRSVGPERSSTRPRSRR